MSRAAARLERLVDSPDLGILASGALFVAHFRKSVTASTLAELEAAHEALRRRAPNGVAMLNVIEPGIPIPADDMKMAVARSFRRIAGFNSCSATVIGGVGFWASAARSTLTALTLLARPACPSKAFGDVVSALAWMELVVPEDVESSRALVDAIEQWKARAPA